MAQLGYMLPPTSGERKRAAMRGGLAGEMLEASPSDMVWAREPTDEHCMERLGEAQHRESPSTPNGREVYSVMLGTLRVKQPAVSGVDTGYPRASPRGGHHRTRHDHWKEDSSYEGELLLLNPGRQGPKGEAFYCGQCLRSLRNRKEGLC